MPRGFALLLEALGAQVSRVAARVWGEAGLAPPFDHLALIVRPADGSGPWLADVGFGSHSDYPLLLDARDDQDDPAGRFRLADADAGDIDVLKDQGRPPAVPDGDPRAVSGRVLIQAQDGTRAERRLETDDELLAAYRDHFGVVLSRVPDDPAG